jgi:tetratricopeptide (TPR) repeat protein
MKQDQPSTVNRHWKRLLQAHRAEHTALTLGRCRALLAVEPRFHPAWVVFGITCTTLCRFAEAEAAHIKALTLAPKARRHFVHRQLGHLEEARGNLRQAMHWFRRGARGRPDDAGSWIFCGHIAFAQGRLKQAEKFNRRALCCKEGAIDEAWFNLGGALLAQDRLEEARECYLKAIAIDPKYAIAKKRLKDVELAIAERAQDAPTPSPPRKSQRAAAKIPATAVRARSRRR